MANERIIVGRTFEAPIRKLRWRALARVTVTTFSCFDLGVSMVDKWIWILLGVALVAYAFMFRSILQALDLLWQLIGMTGWNKSSRRGKPVVVYIICATMLSWTYQSCYTSDTMKLGSIPNTMVKYSEKGFRFWLSPGDYPGIPLAYLAAENTGSFTKKQRAVSKKIFGDNIFDFFHAEKIPFDDPLKFIKILVEKKLLFFFTHNNDYVNRLGSQLNYVLDGKLCDTVDMSQELGISVSHYIKLIGFVRVFLNHAIRRWLEAGIFDRGIKLTSSPTQLQKFSKLNISSAKHQFLPPQPVGMSSAVGVMFFVVTTVGMVLVTRLVVWESRNYLQKSICGVYPTVFGLVNDKFIIGKNWLLWICRKRQSQKITVKHS